MFVPVRTHTQNFEDSVSIETNYTAEQCSSEFKVGDQEGRRLRSRSHISRSSRAGAIMADVSTEVPMESVFAWKNVNMMITLVGVKVYSSKRVERKGVLIASLV